MQAGKCVILDLYLDQDAFFELREVLWVERDGAANSTRRKILNRLGDEVTGTLGEFYPLPGF